MQRSKTILFICLLVASGLAHALPTAKITLKVIDENGLPVKGAKVAANFSVGGSGSLDKNRTDSDGLATLSNSGIRHVEYGAHKEGYYRSGNEFDFKSISGITGFRRWQPWNETLTLVLKKIKNPRALYIGSHKGGSYLSPSINMPGYQKRKVYDLGLGEEYAYDLVVDDWVVPHGKGKHSDFIFKLTGQVTGNRESDFSLIMTFSNDGDGIQKHDAHPIYGSRLRLPHDAPIDGYGDELIQRRASTYNHFIANDFPDDRNYFFRIRTKKDEQGNIVSALYGKIYGNIDFSAAGSISMLYYLNPDPNDRNLESDYKKNMFPSKHKYGFTEYPP